MYSSLRVRKSKLPPEQLAAMRKILDWLIGKKPQTVNKIASQLHLDAGLVQICVSQHRGIQSENSGKKLRYFTTVERISFKV